jgi:hypothetical protein
MSPNHFATGRSSCRADQVTARVIAELESAIRTKHSPQKLERHVDTMHQELIQMHSKVTTEKPAAAVASTTLFEIFIRFVLTVCNIVAAHLLVQT